MLNSTFGRETETFLRPPRVPPVSPGDAFLEAGDVPRLNPILSASLDFLRTRSPPGNHDLTGVTLQSQRRA